MAFLVVEMHPRAAGMPHERQRIRMGERVIDVLGWWGYEGDDLDVATVELSRHLTGPWSTFAQFEIPPGHESSARIGLRPAPLSSCFR